MNADSANRECLSIGWRLTSFDRGLDMKKKTIAAIAGAAAVVIGGSAVYGVISRNSSEKKYAQQQEHSEAQQKAEEERKQMPILTIGDTDNERRYGYEVLYKHDGMTITIEKCVKHGDTADLTLKFVNDTDEELTVAADYFAPNSYISNCDMAVDVPANGKKTETVEGFNDLLRKSEEIKDIRMVFNVLSDNNDYYRVSKQIHVMFDLKSTEPDNFDKEPVLYSEEAGITMWFIETKADQDDYGEINGTVFECYVRNDSDIDQKLSLKNYTCYSGGKEIEAENRLNNLVPAHTGHYVLMRFLPNNYSGELPQIDKIVIEPRTSDNTTYETLLSADPITISNE